MVALPSTRHTNSRPLVLRPHTAAETDGTPPRAGSPRRTGVRRVRYSVRNPDSVGVRRPDRTDDRDPGGALLARPGPGPLGRGDARRGDAQAGGRAAAQALPAPQGA